MPVKLSQENSKLLQDNGITNDQVKKTVETYRQQGLTDDVIQQRLDEKISSFSKITPSVDIKTSSQNEERVPPHKQFAANRVQPQEKKNIVSDVLKLSGSPFAGVYQYQEYPGAMLQNLGKDIKEYPQGLAFLLGTIAKELVQQPYSMTSKGVAPGTALGVSAINTAQKIPEAAQTLGSGLATTYHLQSPAEGYPRILPSAETLSMYPVEHPLGALIDVLTLGRGAGALGRMGVAAGKIPEASMIGKAVSIKNAPSVQVGNQVLDRSYSANPIVKGLQVAGESQLGRDAANLTDAIPGIKSFAADFMGIKPESRFLGESGALTRATKLTEQTQQQAHIIQRNKAIQEIQETFKGLDPAQGKQLIQDIESGKKVLPELQRFRDIMKQRSEATGQYYKDKGLLDETTEMLTPIKQMMAKKLNKNVSELTEKEIKRGSKQISRMPDTQKPFYIPIMFDKNLSGKLSDFFANSTRRYKPASLKQRTKGGNIEQTSHGQRVFDITELYKRMEVQRLKMANTENLIKEITTSYAKPYKVGDELLPGHVPFSPDGMLHFYKKMISTNDIFARHLDELDDLDEAIKLTVKNVADEAPLDSKTFVGVAKNKNIYQVPQEVADVLMSGKGRSSGLGKNIRGVTNYWKYITLGTNPKWWLTNRVGNLMMNTLSGVGLKDYKNALKYSDDLMPDELTQSAQYTAEVTTAGMNKPQISGIESIVKPLYDFNTKFEYLERKAAFMSSLDKNKMKSVGQRITSQDVALQQALNDPKSVKIAIDDVNTTLGDYINMTPFERRVIKPIIPFYSWMRTITRFTANLPERNPYRLQLMSKLEQANSINQQESNAGLPEYQQGSVPIGMNPITENQIGLNLTHSIPFSTFNEMSDNPTGSLNPMLQIPLEAATGRNFFMNKYLTSPNYADIEGRLYNQDNEQLDRVPFGSRLISIPVRLGRTMVPFGDELNKLLTGSPQYLYDTTFGGYSKEGSGMPIELQALRYLLPIQELYPEMSVNSQKFRKIQKNFAKRK